MPQDRNEIYQFGSFRISLSERVLRRDGRIVPLTPKCFDTLYELARHRGSVVEKEKLIAAVWPDSFVEEGNLAQNIFTLRKALGTTPGGGPYIETIPKRGYRLAVQVEETSATPAKPDTSAPTPAPPRRIPYLIAAGAVLATTLVAARWVWPAGDRSVANPRITLLTVANNLLVATISPDGRQIAYVSDDIEGQSLWVRETEGVGAGTRLVAAAPGHYWGVGFSPAGDWLYYVFNEEAHAADSALFRISVHGGPSQKLLTGVAAPPSFSPDGERILYKRYDPDGRGYLLTATPLGADIKVLAQSDASYPFYGLDWGPDGKAIRYIERTGSSNATAWAVWELPSGGGAAKLLMGPQPKPLHTPRWLNDSEFLILMPDGDSGIQQIWRARLGGTFRRLTSGITDYSDIALTADRRTILAASQETHDGIWIAPVSGKSGAQPVRMPLPPGEYNYPVWTPDGRVLFAGQENLWISTADGLDRKPLVPEKVDVLEPSLPADGRFVVFTSRRGGLENLWRVDLDGRNYRQVTTGQFDSHSAVSPDGKWVVYESHVPAPWTLCKLPLDAPGPPVKLAENEGAESGISISPDGKRFAYRTDIGGIAVRSLDDGTLVRRMTAPLDPYDLRWSADGKAVIYICHSGRSTQVWSQPIDGGPPERVAQPLPDDVLHAVWSRDGNRIVYLQRQIKTDLALVRGF